MRLSLLSASCVPAHSWGSIGEEARAWEEGAWSCLHQPLHTQGHAHILTSLPSVSLHLFPSSFFLHLFPPPPFPLFLPSPFLLPPDIYFSSSGASIHSPPHAPQMCGLIIFLYCIFTIPLLCLDTQIFTNMLQLLAVFIIVTYSTGL